MVGPTWQGLFGHDVQLSDGSTVTADENYIRESILEPNAKVVEGYPAVMNTYQGQLNNDQINAIIEYIKTLE
jgi:cytochrome c oxidase subunit 2